MQPLINITLERESTLAEQREGSKTTELKWNPATGGTPCHLRAYCAQEAPPVGPVNLLRIKGHKTGLSKQSELGTDLGENSTGSAETPRQGLPCP